MSEYDYPVTLEIPDDYHQRLSNGNRATVEEALTDYLQDETSTQHEALANDSRDEHGFTFYIDDGEALEISDIHFEWQVTGELLIRATGDAAEIMQNRSCGDMRSSRRIRFPILLKFEPGSFELEVLPCEQEEDDDEKYFPEEYGL